MCTAEKSGTGMAPESEQEHDQSKRSSTRQAHQTEIFLKNTGGQIISDRTGDYLASAAKARSNKITLRGHA